MFRYALGSLLLLAGMTLLAVQGLSWLDLEPKLQRALQGGAICALGTALGAVPVLVIRQMPQVVSDILLGFGARVMLAATAFPLIVPGIAAAENLGLTLGAADRVLSDDGDGFGVGLRCAGLVKRCFCGEELAPARLRSSRKISECGYVWCTGGAIFGPLRSPAGASSLATRARAVYSPSSK